MKPSKNQGGQTPKNEDQQNNIPPRRHDAAAETPETWDMGAETWQSTQEAFPSTEQSTQELFPAIEQSTQELFPPSGESMDTEKTEEADEVLDLDPEDDNITDIETSETSDREEEKKDQKTMTTRGRRRDYKALQEGEQTRKRCPECTVKNRKIRTLQTNNTKLKNDIKDLNKKTGEIQTTLDTVSQKVDADQKEMNKIQTELKANQIVSDQMKKEKMKLLLDIKNLQKDLKQERERKKPDENGQEKDKTIEKLKEEKQKNEDQINIQEEEIEKLREDQMNLLTQEAEKEEEIKAIIKEMTERNEQLEINCKRLEDEMKKMHGEMETMQQTIIQLRIEKERMSAEQKENMERDINATPKYLILGDSNAVRTAEAISNSTKDFTMITTYNTNQLKEYVEENDRIKERRAVIVMTGTNDIMKGAKADRVLKEIMEVTDEMERNGISYHLVQIPPNDSLERRNQETPLFNRLLEMTYEGKVIKTYEDLNPPESLADDKYHLNEKGAKIVATAILKRMEEIELNETDESPRKKQKVDNETEDRKTEEERTRTVTMQKEVEPKTAGRIIGKDGNRIKQVKRKHNVAIQVHNRNDKTFFEITGPLNKAKEAARDIEGIIEEDKKLKEKIIIASQNRKKQTCWNYYQTGRCEFGKNCWFSHENRPLDKSLQSPQREKSPDRCPEKQMRDDIRVVIKQDKREKHEERENEAKTRDRNRPSPRKDRERSRERTEKDRQRKDSRKYESYKENRAPQGNRRDRSRDKRENRSWERQQTCTREKSYDREERRSSSKKYRERKRTPEKRSRREGESSQGIVDRLTSLFKRK